MVSQGELPSNYNFNTGTTTSNVIVCPLPTGICNDTNTINVSQHLPVNDVTYSIKRQSNDEKYETYKDVQDLQTDAKISIDNIHSDVQYVCDTTLYTSGLSNSLNDGTLVIQG